MFDYGNNIIKCRTEEVKKSTGSGCNVNTSPQRLFGYGYNDQIIINSYLNNLRDLI